MATYPLENGYARVLAAAEEKGAETEELPNGGRALVDADRPSSVYLAYEGEPYQVEVYDPSPDRALELVTSGAIQPVRCAAAELTAETWTVAPPDPRGGCDRPGS